MEARIALRASAISRSTAAVVAAVLAAFVLGGTGGYLLKALSLPVAPPIAPPIAHSAAEWPAALEPGSAWSYRTQRAGTMSVEGPAPATLTTSASFREPGSRRGGSQS